MDDGGFEEFSCVVDGGPEVLGTRDEDGGVSGCADGLFKGVELEVAPGGIVREDAGGAACPACVALADAVEVVGDGLIGGCVVVEQKPFAVAGGLDPPDGHVVGDADIPGGEDGEVRVGLEGGGDVAAFHEVEKLDGVDGAVGKVIERFFRCGGVLLLDEGAESAALAEVPSLLGIGEGAAEAFFEGIEVGQLVGGGLGLPAGEFVLWVFVPREEIEF